MAQSRLETSLRAFRHRNFRFFFAGQLTSLVGTWMKTVAQSWLVYRLTGSAELLGIVGFASQFPVLVLAPIAGSVADTYPRRRSMLAIQTAAMLLAFPLAALTLLNRIQVWHILVLAVLLGIVNAFDIPVRQSFVAEMVGREDLVNAIALNSSMMNGARIIGPAVAGIVVATIGEGWCFLINGLSYLAVIVGLLFITSGNQAPQEEHTSHTEAILEGFRVVLHTRPVRTLLMLIGVILFMGMAPFGALLAGLLATRLGAPLTVAIGGMVCVGGAAIFRSKLPAVRAEGRQLILAQMMTAGEPPESGSPNISS